MCRKLLFLIVLMTATSLFAQSPDTLYIYETVVKHDTLYHRDTIYLYDTVQLIYLRQDGINKKRHKAHSTARKKQENPPLQEELFQGIHIGYTGQFDLMLPAKVTDNESLSSTPGVGGHAGIEISYHFSKWFGVSAALNYGTTGTFRVNYIERTYIYAREPDFTLHDPIPSEHKKRYAIYSTGISMPVKFEFHYPISPKVWVTADVGARLRMPQLTFANGYDKRDSNRDSWVGQTVNIDPSSLTPFSSFTLQPDFIDRSIFNVDILASIGMYFRLRNNDLFRWNIGFNAALQDFSRGHYTYGLYDNVYRYDFWDCVGIGTGEYRLRNHHLYAQIAYIHTLQNAKQKQETAPYALKYGNEKMYKHEFKLEVSGGLTMRWLQLPGGHIPNGAEKSYASIHNLMTPIISACYSFRVTPWFWIGASVNYSNYSKDVYIRYGHEIFDISKEGTRTYHLLGIMPHVRFSYFNRPHVTLYSGLSVGVDLHIPGKYEGDEKYKEYYPDPLFYSAFQATLFGVKAGGKHWFGSFELGAGYKGIASLGVGYEF
jgi:hypothetical protein